MFRKKYEWNYKNIIYKTLIGPIFNELNFQTDQNNQDDSDSEVDEVEPKLKFVRMGNDLEHILQNDAASCIAVHPKV